MGICSVDECGRPVRCRGFCNSHYLRLLRHGDATIQLRRSPGSVTKEDVKRWKRLNYERNKDKYIAKARKWELENWDKRREYFSRPDVAERMRQRTKEWSAKNKEKKRAYDKAWVASNRALANSYKAHRRAKVRMATPPWLTDEHRAQIAAIYAEAARLTETTGTPYHVDHIVPLSGKYVSGLHVPWNLRPLPGEENNRRPRVWIDQSV